MSGMFLDRRSIAVAFCAIGAFLHLYAPQAVLPMMAREYGVGAADASLIITADRLPEVQEEVNANGFQLLNKPVKPAQLRSLMTSMLS